LEFAKSVFGDTLKTFLLEDLGYGDFTTDSLIDPSLKASGTVICKEPAVIAGLWEARSFLGRCYRSFQYEFMVSLNLKRHDPEMRIMLIDDPGVRDLRYQEIRSPREFLAELASLPVSDQARALRSRYDAYRAAYEDMRVYEKMILHPDSALLEVSPELARLRSREEYIAERIEESKPDLVLLRLLHCLTKLPGRLESSSGIEQPMAGRVASIGNVMKLSEAERIVGPLPARD